MKHMQSSNRTAKWARLLAGMAMILVFVYVIAPLGMRIPTVAAFATVADDRNIEVSAFYYTGVTVVGEAEMNCRGSVAFAQRK